LSTHIREYPYKNVQKSDRAVFGSCYQWVRKPQNNPITASYYGGLTP